MVLCEDSVYERVLKFIEFDLGRVKLMHIGISSTIWLNINLSLYNIL